jgi:putative GTP pyrophosphokinase
MTDDSASAGSFFEQYKRYIEEILLPTEKEVKTILRQWKSPGYWASNRSDLRDFRVASPSPVQRIRSRVKRAESVEDKILRRCDVFDAGLTPPSFRKMNDTVGVRVILYFLCHFPLIDRELRRMEDYFEISPTEKPKAYLPPDLFNHLALTGVDRKDKESGYASVHYILRLRRSKVTEVDRPWFELQVRTIIEDAWGEVEHVLGYKPGKWTSMSVKTQFKIISKQLGAIDEHFNHLHSELTKTQEKVEHKPSDQLNAENLPSQLADVGIGCAQGEIDGLLKVLVSRQISTVEDLRRVATPSRFEIIRNTFSNVAGRPPNNFELVANLAGIADTDDAQQQIDRIRNQINLLTAWESIREHEKQLNQEKQKPKDIDP